MNRILDTRAKALDADERLDRLRLIRTENIGPITFRGLIARFGSAGAAIAALPDLARRGGRRQALSVPSRAMIEREVAAIRRLGARQLIYGDPEYPAMLAAVEDAPAVLSVLGDATLLSRRSVAIVGARNASINGRGLAERLARRIGDAGYVVVSGMARGIDGHAHRGAMASGTVAVLAGGVDVTYPPEHADLQVEIAAHGAVVAELPPGTTPTARHFPARNRIIAGLCLGVVVVEAARRSGSLITARQALDQGREVFSVPGSPLDPRSAGTNGLLKEGAAFLVETADDILRVLDSQPGPRLAEPAPEPPWPAAAGSSAPAPAQAPDGVRAEILAALGAEPVAVDELIRRCQLSAPVVATLLLESELAGLVDRHPGNLVSRRANVPA